MRSNPEHCSLSIDDATHPKRRHLCNDFLNASRCSASISDGHGCPDPLLLCLSVTAHVNQGRRKGVWAALLTLIL